MIHALSSLGGVKQGLSYPLTLPVTWMRCLFCPVRVWVGPYLCREDVITRAHTLHRRHLSLPFAGLVSFHLLPFQEPKCILGQNLGMAEAVPVLLCITSAWAPSTWVGIAKEDLVLQQWGVLPTLQTDKSVCMKFKGNIVRSSCHINKTPKAE